MVAYKGAMDPIADRLDLDQLAERCELPARTVRYYIQRGLVDRPEGERRGAYYTARHLEQLLRIRRWTEAGLSLDGIARLLSGESDAPAEAVRAGSIAVRTHVALGDGLELVIDPDRARLSTAEVRELAEAVEAALRRLRRRKLQGE
jgi:DNA-binding transcriptional MerR regulator